MWLKAINNTLLTLVGLAFFFAAIAVHVFGFIWTLAAIPLGVASFLVAQFVSTLVHELGHVAGAMFSNWRVLRINVLPLEFRPAPLAFRLTLNSSVSDLLGFVAAGPTSIAGCTTWAVVLVYLSGPLASLALGVPCLIVASHLAAPNELFLSSSPANEAWSSFVLGLGIQSLGAFVLTLWPVGSNRDGAKALEAIIHRKPNVSIANDYVGTIASLDRPRAVEDWMMDTSATSSPEVLRYIQTIEVARALDSSPPQLNRARALISDFADGGDNSDWLCACDAFLRAAYEDDVEGAKLRLTQRAYDNIIPELVLAAEAAIAARQGKREQMTKMLDQMDDIVIRRKGFPDACYTDIRATVEGLTSQAFARPGEAP